MRNSQIIRNTNETKITLSLALDGTGKSEVVCGCGFLEHMLTLFAAHGRFDLTLYCEGDLAVDDHHTVEDIGIALGEAFNEALQEKKGIARYGDVTLPMDEALILAAVDLSGRSYLAFDVAIPSQKIGTFDSELVEEFLLSFVRNCPMNLHVKMLSGKNSHHIVEGVFKAVSRALRAAVAIDPALQGEVPSTKGVL